MKVVLILPELILIGPIPLNWSCERESTRKWDFFTSDNWRWCEIDFYMSKNTFLYIINVNVSKIHLNVSNNTLDLE